MELERNSGQVESLVSGCHCEAKNPPIIGKIGFNVF
jgi:hypothetical protein